MEDAEFKAKLKEAKTIVSKWPSWKKASLSNSFKANNPGPRDPIVQKTKKNDNRRG